MVRNTSDMDVEITVECITASTNEYGQINYTTQPQWPESSLKYGFTQITQVPRETIALPAGASEQVSIVVRMPEEPIEGVILGAIHIVQSTISAPEGSLSQQFAYAIAVQLSMKDESPDPVMEMGEIDFTPQNNLIAITAQVRNTAPVVAKEMAYSRSWC